MNRKETIEKVCDELAANEGEYHIWKSLRRNLEREKVNIHYQTLLGLIKRKIYEITCVA